MCFTCQRIPELITVYTDTYKSENWYLINHLKSFCKQYVLTKEIKFH